MPPTLLHLGPALLLGVVLYRYVDLPTVLLASVVVDVRAALVLYGPLEGPVHGVLTTVAGGTLLALLVGGVVLALPPSVQRLGSPLRLASTVRAKPIFLGAWLGVISHVLLDAMVYSDVQPLWPLEANPLLLSQVTGAVVAYSVSVLAAGIGLGAFLVLARQPAGTGP